MLNFVCSSRAFRLFLLLLTLFAVSSFLSVRADANIYRSENPERLLFKIRIPTTVGERAAVVFPDGSEEALGRVLEVPVQTKYPGFTASKYGIGGQIIATAVNAHHIQVAVDDGAGRTMSILPSRTYADASGTDSSFVIEGEGGSGIWGHYAPYVSSPVYIINRAGIPVLFNNPSLYQYAQAVEIRVYPPEDDIEYIEIENEALGRAFFRDAKGEHDFGVVESKVSSTGRFEGSLYQGRGLVRANHPGVICISTCDKGKIGGFQIVPRSHTFAKELQKTRNMSQYIILRGAEFDDLTGLPPFFRGAVRPGDERDPVGRTGVVMCRIEGEWQEMPDVVGLTDRTLGHIEAFRIYLK